MPKFTPPREIDRYLRRVARRLNQLVKAHGLTHAKIAHLTGRTRPAVSLVLKGTTRPGLDDVHAIARLTGLTPAQVIAFE